jgi:hypothetical protein
MYFSKIFSTKDGEKADRGEPGARSVTSFFSSSFYGAFRRRLVPPRLGRRAPPEGCLCGEQEEEEKEAYPPAGTSLQVFLYRTN